MTTSFDVLRHPIVFEVPRRLSVKSAWNQHIPFGMLLVELMRPRSIVELGTHWGPSYCAFCQAVDSLRLSTRCCAVDTWQGDTDAGHYGEEVLQSLRRHHDPLYGSFSTLLRSTFEEALPKLGDGSIDLLHIDGLHSYEAVRHDYESWLPKMSDRGIILFHDTAVRDRGFGVYKLWSEISNSANSFEFHHGFGLGALMTGADVPAEARDFFAAANRSPDAMRQLFSSLGERLDLIAAREGASTRSALAAATLGRLRRTIGRVASICNLAGAR